MFKKLVPLNQNAHKDLKIKPLNDFMFTKDFHIASVMVHEFMRAAATYPIVFIEDKDGFRPVVMLGLEAGKNLFLDEDGQWQVKYIPAIIRRYPFALSNSNVENEFTICLDEDSDVIQDSEGEALFDQEGEPTEVIENVKKFLGELQSTELLTADFSERLKANNMLVPVNVNYVIGTENRNVTGCYAINEERLNQLSDEVFSEFKNMGLLPAIYAQIISMGQIENLVAIKSKQASAAETTAIH